MIYRELRFSDFTSLENLIQVQNEFLAFDFNIQRMKDVQITDGTLTMISFDDNTALSNSVIKIVERNEFTGTESEKKIKFYEDFLMPKISVMSAVAFSKFKSEIEEKGIYGNFAQDGFVRHIKNNINKFAAKIKASEFLETNIQKKLLKELEKYENHLEGYLLNPYPEFKQKIQFNWNRTDVVLFFHLLRENKKIVNISDADLGRILDSVFEYYSEEERKHCQIKNSRKLLNEFSNTKGRSEDRAIERLKEIFKNQDFYSL